MVRPLSVVTTYDLFYDGNHRPIILWKHLLNLLHGLPSPHHQVETSIKYYAWIPSSQQFMDASVYNDTDRYRPGIFFTMSYI